MRRLIAAVAAATLVLAGCSAQSTDAPPPVTKTELTTTTVQTPVTRTATAVETVTTTITAPAATSDLSGDQMYCAVIDAVFSYVDAVEENYKKPDGTVTIDYFVKVANDTYDALARISDFFIPSELDEMSGNVLVDIRFALIGLGARGEGGIAKYDRSRTELRTTCDAIR